jgi:hypothetical protein
VRKHFEPFGGAGEQCHRDEGEMTLRGAGKNEEAARVERETDAYYPELNPANWPINRQAAAMRAEYIERAKSEEL